MSDIVFKSTKEANLTELTRWVLIIGIICTIGGIILLNQRESDEYPIFLILNENKEMKDFPTTANVEENITLHGYVKSYYKNPTEFMLKLYTGDNDTVLNVSKGVENYNTSLENIVVPHPLEFEEDWTSLELNFSFLSPGSNQIIIFELWKKEGTTWKYMPDFMLFIRIDVI